MVDYKKPKKIVPLGERDIAELKVAQIRHGKIRILFNDGRPEGVFERQICLGEVFCNDSVTARMSDGDMFLTDPLKSVEVVLDIDPDSGKTRAVLKMYY